LLLFPELLLETYGSIYDEFFEEWEPSEDDLLSDTLLLELPCLKFYFLGGVRRGCVKAYSVFA
jgi:hypothetical protein